MNSVSIRPFIGAKNYDESREFYRDLGFEEIKLGPKMSFFKVNDKLGFYLQDYYVKDWVDNSMIFLEVEDVNAYEQFLLGKKLTEKYNNVRISDIQHNDWGSEIFLHDPAGVLWHFGVFK